jgi:hypothetical protein
MYDISFPNKSYYSTTDSGFFLIREHLYRVRTSFMSRLYPKKIAVKSSQINISFWNFDFTFTLLLYPAHFFKGWQLAHSTEVFSCRFAYPFFMPIFHATIHFFMPDFRPSPGFHFHFSFLIFKFFHAVFEIFNARRSGHF